MSCIATPFSILGVQYIPFAEPTIDACGRATRVPLADDLPGTVQPRWAAPSPAPSVTAAPIRTSALIKLRVIKCLLRQLPPRGVFRELLKVTPAVELGKACVGSAVFDEAHLSGVAESGHASSMR